MNQHLFFLISIILLCSTVLFSQDQRIADSLKRQIVEDKGIDSNYLSQLSLIASYEQSPDSIEYYASKLIVLASSISNYSFLEDGYLHMGNAKKLNGDLDSSLIYYFLALKSPTSMVFEGRILSSIADVYSISGNSENALSYYDQAIHTLLQTNDTSALASVYSNKGDEYLIQEKYDSSLIYFLQSKELFASVKDELGEAFTLGNEGIAYAGLGEDNLAESKLNESIKLLEASENYYFISVYLTYLSDIYATKNQYKKSLKYANRSLELGQKYGLTEQISDASLVLSNLYTDMGDEVKALKYYKDHITFRDSLINLETVEQLANQRTEFEVAEKQFEVDLLEEQKKNQRLTIYGTLAGLGAMVLFAIGLFRRNRFIKATNKIIEAEKQKSDNLLLNILPSETAEELKQNGKVLAKRHEGVSVFFSDFVGFTKFSENLSPNEVVDQLDFYFSKFDTIVEKYGLEKIKTIGDAYMCVSGLHKEEPNHAKKIIIVAKEIQQFVADMKKEKAEGVPFDIRIGINSGPVVAGVVGHKKFAYDIWGDTVNMASRMESNSEVGRINISEYTFDLVKDEYDCYYHKDFVTKNGRAIKMYYLKD